MVKNMSFVLNQPPQKVFTRGSVVSGTLSFDLDKPKSYDYISVSLVGRANVYWRRGRRSSYIGAREYVNQQIVVWKKEQVPDGKLQPGHYSFLFRFTLPNGQIPPTFYLRQQNHIRYCLEGRIGTGLLKLDHRIYAEVPVAEVVNINLPQLQKSQRRLLVRIPRSWCCASGAITLTAEIPRSGYCVGEVIPLTCTVENNSSHEANVSAKLKQVVTCYVRGNTNRESGLVLSALSDPIPARTSRVWSPGEEFKISTERAPTLLSCDILTVEYVLIVTVVIPWSINFQKITFPLTIGNVPFRNPREATGSRTSTTVPLLNLIRAFAAAATDVSSHEQNEELDTTELSTLLA